MNEIVFALICTPFLMVIFGVYVIRAIQRKKTERIKQKLDNGKYFEGIVTKKEAESKGKYFIEMDNQYRFQVTTLNKYNALELNKKYKIVDINGKIVYIEKREFYDDNAKGLLDYRYDNYYNEQEKQKELQHVLNRAEQILHSKYSNQLDYINDYHPIFSYIRMFTLSIQTENAINIIKQNGDRLGHKNMNYTQGYFEFMEKIILQYRGAKVKALKQPYTAKLGHTPFITWTWDADRIIDSLLIIGRNVREQDNYLISDEDKERLRIKERLKTFPFKENNNHQAVYIYPLGFVYTTSGNHSINSGIIQSEGEVTINEYIDARHLYNDWEFDGTYLINKKQDKNDGTYLINKKHDEYIVTDFKFGALFEIGRLLMKYPQLFPKEIRESIK